MRRGWLIMEDVWAGMRGQPGRVGLSILSLTVGVSSLCVLLAVLDGLRSRSRRLVEELGANVIAAYPAANAKAQTLQRQQIDLLRANLKNTKITAFSKLPAPPGSDFDDGMILGTDAYLPEVRPWALLEGRCIDAVDVREGARAAVLTHSLSKRLDLHSGNILRLADSPFRIVGILAADDTAESSGTAGASSGEEHIFLPYTVVPTWSSEKVRPDHAVHALFIKLPSGMTPAQGVRRAEAILADPGRGCDEIAWVTPQTLVAGVRRLQTMIGATAGTISVLCILLGGTTLMSLMIANVRDRIVEIGLRRAMGARRTDIAALFVLEACAITGASAVAAVVLSHTLLLIAGTRLAVPLELGWTSSAVPLAASLFLGAAFSYWPARMASQIEPSQALRNQ